MTATGNEAVSLSQLKQYSQTLGGGSDDVVLSDMARTKVCLTPIFAF